METRWTRELLDKCIALQKQGLSLPDIANLKGLNYGTLRVQLHYYRSGFRKFAFEKHERRRERMVSMIENGLMVCDIARMHGTSKANVRKILDGVGYDAELRRERWQELGIIGPRKKV